MPPAIVLEIEGSVPLAIAAGAVLVLMAGALLIVPWGAWAPRLLSAAATVLLAAPPLAELTLVLGRRSVRRAEWAASGAWRISNGRNGLPALLSRRTALVGRWVFLAWTTPEGPRMAIAHPWSVPPDVLRALRVRLRLYASNPGEPGRY